MIRDRGSGTLFRRPEELTPAYLVLATGADSGFVTGEIIAVTGGIVDTR
jgi:hypothetical protein